MILRWPRLLRIQPLNGKIMSRVTNAMLHLSCAGHSVRGSTDSAITTNLCLERLSGFRNGKEADYSKGRNTG